MDTVHLLTPSEFAACQNVSAASTARMIQWQKKGRLMACGTVDVCSALAPEKVTREIGQFNWGMSQSRNSLRVGGILDLTDIEDRTANQRNACCACRSAHGMKAQGAMKQQDRSETDVEPAILHA